MTEQSKVFIDIAPSKDKKVCGNCKHLIIWGVSTGMCMNRKKPTDKMLTQTCNRFLIK